MSRMRIHTCPDEMIAAVVTTFKPDPAFASRFAHLLSVCGVIVVSDNTPGGHGGFDLPEGFKVIHHRSNLGLGPALNIGIEAAREFGASTVVLFDQDSTPSAEFVIQMARCLAEAQASLGNQCCVGPTHLDDGNEVIGGRPGFDSQPESATIAISRDEVTCLPTSGMILPIGGLAADDLFSNEFFLDLVDFEWCWRLRARGWHFLRSRRVCMLHRLGEAERSFLGLRYHVPSPYRHYFQVRDSLRLIAKSYVPFYSKVRLVGILPLKAIVYPFLLDRGAERLTWMMRGLRDSLRGIRGVGAVAHLLSN